MGAQGTLEKLRLGRPRWIELDGAVNARAVVPGVLLRADNLQSLSPRDVRRLVDEDALEVVVDLRTDVEAKLEGPGPMAGEPGVRIELRSLHPDSGSAIDLRPARSGRGMHMTRMSRRTSRRWYAPT